MFRFDKRIIYIILGVAVLTSILGKINTKNEIISLLLTLPAILIAITFHEFAHAFAADKLGDDTPRRQGRLTLNPIAHIDIMGFVLLIIAGIGWGKPVQVNPVKFNRKVSMSKGEAIVSLAGPLTNFILAILTTIIMSLMIKFGWFTTLSAQSYLLIYIFLIQLIYINIGLGVFNLIPLPPLDGSKILKNFLPYNAKSWFERNEYILYFVFIIIWVTPIASTIIAPCISGIANGLLTLAGKIIGL